MTRFQRIHIGGFRRLYDVDLEMRPLMVMIGANGVGKTSILDVFSMLADSAAGRLNTGINEMGGITGILTNGKATKLFFDLEMEIPNYKPLKYELGIVPKGISYSIEEEKLSQERIPKRSPFVHITSQYGDIKYYEVDENKLVHPNWEYNPLETSLSQVPKMFREPEELRRILSSCTFYHVLNVAANAPVRLPQKMKPANLPGKDGEDLAPFLYSLREGDQDRFESVEDTLKAAFPGFERLNFPPAAAGVLAMTWKDKDFTTPLYVHQLSEGTLRFLWLTSLLHSPSLPSVTLIDEPEVSLHPELLSHFVELLREASQRTQLIVATHSDRLVRFLKPEEVVVMDIDENGFATAKWADTFDLDEWLKEYTLDEVWRLGRMGGRA